MSHHFRYVMNNAQYVRHVDTLTHGDIFMIWYGSELVTIVNADDGTEIDCFHDYTLSTHLDAHASMTEWLDTQEDMAHDYALDNEMGN